jgi:hypothetical protein
MNNFDLNHPPHLHLIVSNCIWDIGILSRYPVSNMLPCVDSVSASRICGTVAINIEDILLVIPGISPTGCPQLSGEQDMQNHQGVSHKNPLFLQADLRSPGSVRPEVSGMISDSLQDLVRRLSYAVSGISKAELGIYAFSAKAV